MIKCEILTTESNVESIASEWRQLQDTVGTIPYTGYGWCAAWWQNIGKPKGKQLAVVTGRVDQKLVAVLALSVQNKRGIRILQGVGVEAATYCDTLSENPDFTKALWAAVRQSRIYDFAVIRYVGEDSISGQVLATIARRSSFETVTTLPNTWPNSNAWVASQQSNVRRNNNRLMRKLQEKGNVELPVCTSKPVPANIIRALFEHKIVWAAEQNIRGLFDQAGVIPYFQQLADDAADRGQLHLHWITCGGEGVVYSLGFLHRKTLYLKTLSYDPAYLPFSPGNLIAVNAICWAIDNGCEEINFGVGDNNYKMRYASNTKRFNEWVFSGTVKGQLMAKVYFATRAFKNMRAKQKEKKASRNAPKNQKQ